MKNRKPPRANKPKNADAQTLVVRIERIVPDGAGIGFAENLTVFVPLTAPGDLVKAKIDRKKGNIAFANLLEIIEPSPDRIEPPCPYFGACGGCDFQQLNYAAQLQAKVGILKDCLRRIGKIDWQNPIEIIASPHDFGYRTRAQWKRENQKLGYFERNSHRTIDIKICPILAEPLQNELANWRARLQVEKSNFNEIQAVCAGENVSTRFSTGAHEFDENFYAANRELSNQSRSETAAQNEAAQEISFKLEDFEYRFSAATFFQVNHRVLPEFVRFALADYNGDFALDLFCGVGLFALPLAKRFGRVVGVEGNRTSIRFAQKNAALANRANVEFHTRFVGEWLLENKAGLPPVDLVLLDPPRTGAEPETIQSLIEMRPRRIIYVSCNPATLARDLRLLCTNNFCIEQIEAFDFFPQTHHVETIVHLISVK